MSKFKSIVGAALLLLAFPTVVCAAPVETHLNTNLSGTITTGGTFQQVWAGGNLWSVEFQNIAGNGDKCHIEWVAAQPANAASSMTLKDGDYYLRSSGDIPADALWITCDTTNDKFYLSVEK